MRVVANSHTRRSPGSPRGHRASVPLAPLLRCPSIRRGLCRCEAPHLRATRLDATRKVAGQLAHHREQYEAEFVLVTINAGGIGTPLQRVNPGALDDGAKSTRTPHLAGCDAGPCKRASSRRLRGLCGASGDADRLAAQGDDVATPQLAPAAGLDLAVDTTAPSSISARASPPEPASPASFSACPTRMVSSRTLTSRTEPMVTQAHAGARQRRHAAAAVSRHCL
jgi:hypothetical protein